MLSDDVLRFADKLKLDKFTILGHSLGGKVAMTFAGKYPDRVDGVIAVDVAPLNFLKFERQESIYFTYKVLKFMRDL